MKAAISQTSEHYVFVADDNGMNFIFSQLRQQLAEPAGHHITLVYYSVSGGFVFSRELETLWRRFPTQFIWHNQSNAPADAPDALQETLEVVLNSNTKEHIGFTLAGDEELVSLANDRLHFLGVTNDRISSIF